MNRLMFSRSDALSLSIIIILPLIEFQTLFHEKIAFLKKEINKSNINDKKKNNDNNNIYIYIFKKFLLLLILIIINIIIIVITINE